MALIPECLSMSARTRAFIALRWAQLRYPNDPPQQHYDEAGRAVGFTKGVS